MRRTKDFDHTLQVSTYKGMPTNEIEESCQGIKKKNRRLYQ
jgi:hypothetical protein